MGTRLREMNLNLKLWPGQAKALETILDSGKRIDTMMSCGVGGGKTLLLAVLATLLSMRNQHTKAPGLLLSPTFRMAEDVTRPTLEEFWESQGIPYEWRASDKYYTLPLWDSRIWLRSSEKPDRLRGPNLAWAGLDEAAYMPERAYEVIQSRVRHPRARLRRIFGATTPAGFNWVYERFADPKRSNINDTALITWPTFENAALMRADPQYVPRMRRAYSAELFRQEVLGEFLVVGAGRTYHQFSRADNVRDFDIDSRLPLDLCFDFNVAPAACVITQGKGTELIPERAIDEITVSGGQATKLILKEFKDRYPDYADGTGVRVFGDASGDSRKTTGPSDFEEIRASLPYAGMYVRTRNPRQKDRINAFNALLRNADDEVRAYVHSTKCPHTLRDLEQVRNIEGTFQIDKSNPKLTHFSDAWGYKIHYLYPIIAGREERTAA